LTYPKRVIKVKCRRCKHDFDEEDVEFVNVEEDFFGADILTFVCPECGQTTTSNRRG